ncbi:MAG: NAD(+)/NADH kinase [Promethearchaeota archaeon]|nr:MAG: NAD(+)/NADH kinase [Candidatus Lokiarchaeota archaeon]
MDKKAIALASRLDSEDAIKLIKRIFEFLIKKGEVVYLETRIAPKIHPHNGMDLIDMTNDRIKFIVSLGGDGSILRVSQSLPQDNPPPLLGVNIGSIGFLDDSNERAIFRDLKKLLEEQYSTQEVSKITPYLVKKNGDEIKLPNALNDVVVVSSKHSKVLQISVKVNGIFLNRSYLDGIIISTATGSTAYNLSAGGAIVSPKLDVMQLTPLNPYARSGLKPMVIDFDSEIEIKLLRPRLNAKIVIDGQRIIKKIQPNSRIIVRPSTAKAKFIRLHDNQSKIYYKRLRKKIIGSLRVPIDDSPEE